MYIRTYGCLFGIIKKDFYEIKAVKEGENQNSDTSGSDPEEITNNF